MRPRVVLIALLAVALSALGARASIADGVGSPAFGPPAVCANGVAGELPCTWTFGVNAYPGNSDGFRRRGTLAAVGGLVGADRFDTVVIDVPISAANYTDAHVQMPGPGQHEVYNCRSPNANYRSPGPGEVVTIARRVLATVPTGLVIIRPMLALGGSCVPSRYYPTGRFTGSGFSRGVSNEVAFAHFYTAILFRLGTEAERIGHPGHVILDDATGLDCLYDDPADAGYVGYFNSLPGQIRARFPGLAQMFSLDSDYANSPAGRCGWPGSFKGRPAVDETTRDRRFLSEVGLVGIQANYALTDAGSSVPSVVSRWETTRFGVAQGPAQTADAQVRALHAATGADIVMSAIGYNDCSTNPAADPAVQPSWCNKVYGREQGQPSLAEVVGQQNAEQAALCYWSQAEGATDPWFLGLWFWNRDFDATPYVNPYDLTWGLSNRGTSAMGVLRAFARGQDRGDCPIVVPGPSTAAGSARRPGARVINP